MFFWKISLFGYFVKKWLSPRKKTFKGKIFRNQLFGFKIRFETFWIDSKKKFRKFSHFCHFRIFWVKKWKTSKGYALSPGTNGAIKYFLSYKPFGASFISEWGKQVQTKSEVLTGVISKFNLQNWRIWNFQLWSEERPKAGHKGQKILISGNGL